MNQYIIAGNVDQYHKYCKIKGAVDIGNAYVLIESDTRLKYVADYVSLLGIDNPKGALIGTWYNRPDIMSILNTLLGRMHYNPEGAEAIVKAIHFVDNRVEKEFNGSA